MNDPLAGGNIAVEADDDLVVPQNRRTAGTDSTARIREANEGTDSDDMTGGSGGNNDTDGGQSTLLTVVLVIVVVLVILILLGGNLGR